MFSVKQQSGVSGNDGHGYSNWRRRFQVVHYLVVGGGGVWWSSSNAKFGGGNYGAGNGGGGKDVTSVFGSFTTNFYWVVKQDSSVAAEAAEVMGSFGHRSVVGS